MHLCVYFNLFCVDFIKGGSLIVKYTEVFQFVLHKFSTWINWNLVTSIYDRGQRLREVKCNSCPLAQSCLVNIIVVVETNTSFIKRRSCLFKGSRTGHSVKVSLWTASLLTNTIFCFLYFRISNY